MNGPRQRRRSGSFRCPPHGSPGWGLLLAALVAVLLPLSTGLAAEAESAAALLAMGNRAYEEARFDEAAASYERVVDMGIRHETVYYNLGCAHARQGLLGAALLDFRRALWLSPRDEDAQANAAWIRDRLTDSPPPLGGWRERLSRAVALLPLGGSLGAALALEWLAALLLAWAVMTGRRGRQVRGMRRVGISAAVLAILVALAPLTTLQLRNTESGAVILIDRIEARSGPAESNPVLFTVHEGYEVELRSVREGWVRIATPDGLGGWVPLTSLGAVNPDRLPAVARGG